MEPKRITWCTMKTDGAKKYANSPALRSLLPTDEALEMNI